MPLPHSSFEVCASRRNTTSSTLKSRSQNSSSDFEGDPTVARTTCRPRGDHRIVLLVRDVNVSAHANKDRVENDETGKS